MTEATGQALASLAARLTEPEDRETYAGLISYFVSLPEHDELFRLAELLGLLSLLGQRLPGALQEFLAELQRVDSRLGRLPNEIVAGVDAGVIANQMSEAFRQQIAAAGLETTATLLRSACAEITALSGQITASLKPVAREYQSIAATVSSELSKLNAASIELQSHHAQLVQRERSNTWLWKTMLALVLFLAGGLCGISTEKQRTEDSLAGIAAQIKELEISQVPLAKTPARNAKRNRREVTP